MSKTLEDMRNEALQVGLEWGREQGLEQGQIRSIQKLMNSMKWSPEQAMNALQVPEEQRRKYLDSL